MDTLPTIDAERTSLDTHVDLCAQRYQNLDERMGTFESKIDNLTKKVESLHADLWKVLIGSAGTVIASVITVAGVIITHIK